MTEREDGVRKERKSELHLKSFLHGSYIEHKEIEKTLQAMLIQQQSSRADAYDTIQPFQPAYPGIEASTDWR